MEFEQSVSSSTESVSEILKESQERNEKWNAKSAELREKRLKELAEIQLNKSLSKIERKKQKDKELLVKVEEAVKKEKVRLIH